jgi:hypothetical protein
MLRVLEVVKLEGMGTLVVPVYPPVAVEKERA